MVEGKKENADILFYSMYYSLVYLAKQFFDYSIEITPTLYTSDDNILWDDYSFNALLNLGTSTLEYGVPSGKSFLLGSLLAQDLFMRISRVFKEKWPKPPSIEEISNIIIEWYNAHKNTLSTNDVNSYSLLCRGVSLLLRSLFVYSKAIISKSERHQQYLAEWGKVSRMEVLDIEEELKKCFYQSTDRKDNK